MNEYHELIGKRESIRDYDPQKPVRRAVLERIVDAGRLAPSAGNFQPWTFIVISSAEMLKKIRRCYGRPWFREAPHVLVVKGDREKAWTREQDGYNSLETDLTIAMDHMILAAESEGIGTCWIANFDPDALREALSLQDTERVYAVTPLGYPHEGFRKKGEKKRKSLAEVADFI